MINSLGCESPAKPDGGKRLERRKGADREVGSEASAEQTRKPMNKNRITGLGSRASWQILCNRGTDRESDFPGYMLFCMSVLAIEDHP